MKSLTTSTLLSPNDWFIHHRNSVFQNGPSGITDRETCTKITSDHSLYLIQLFNASTVLVFSLSLLLPGDERSNLPDRCSDMDL